MWEPPSSNRLLSTSQESELKIHPGLWPPLGRSVIQNDWPRHSVHGASVLSPWWGSWLQEFASVPADIHKFRGPNRLVCGTSHTKRGGFIQNLKLLGRCFVAIDIWAVYALLNVNCLYLISLVTLICLRTYGSHFELEIPSSPNSLHLPNNARSSAQAKHMANIQLTD